MGWFKNRGFKVTLGVVEMLRQEETDPTMDLVVQQQRAKQGLLRFDGVRHHTGCLVLWRRSWAGDDVGGAGLRRSPRRLRADFRPPEVIPTRLAMSQTLAPSRNIFMIT